MTPKRMYLLAIMAFALLLGAALMVACGGDDKAEEPDGPISCNTIEDCPGGWNCIDGTCQQPSQPDGDEDSDAVDEDPDVDERPLPCDVICCADADCIPPGWTPDEPAWYCDKPGTAESTCLQELPPCEFECCDARDCIEDYEGNPNKCDYFYCQSPGTEDAACANNFPSEYETGKQYCSPRADQTWVYFNISTDESGCFKLEEAECDQIYDCADDNLDGVIECVSSRRCRTDADCVAPLKCDMNAVDDLTGLHKCAVPVVGEGETCAENCVDNGGQLDCNMVAECEEGLTCSVDTSGDQPWSGVCAAQEE